MRFRPTGRTAALALVTAAVLVPLGVFGAPALARSASSASEYQYSSSAQYKVAICHHTHSKKHPWHVINVAAAAVKAHLKHGDTLAPCPTTAPTAPTHGHGNGNGNSGTNGSTTNGPGNSQGHGKGHNK